MAITEEAVYNLAKKMPAPIGNIKINAWEILKPELKKAIAEIKNNNILYPETKERLIGNIYAYFVHWFEVVTGGGVSGCFKPQNIAESLMKENFNRRCENYFKEVENNLKK